MKLVLCIVVCLGVVGSSMCFADEAITEKDIQTFLAIYPEFVVMVEEDLAGATRLQEMQKLQNLLKRYNWNMNDWTRISTRITYGYMALQMQGTNMSPPQLQGPMSIFDVSEEELALIKKYSQQIKSVVDTGTPGYSQSIKNAKPRQCP